MDACDAPLDDDDRAPAGRSSGSKSRSPPQGPTSSPGPNLAGSFSSAAGLSGSADWVQQRLRQLSADGTAPSQPRLTVCSGEQDASNPDDDGDSSDEVACSFSTGLAMTMRWLVTLLIGAAFLMCLIASKLSVLVIGSYIRLHRNATHHKAPNASLSSVAVQHRYYSAGSEFVRTGGVDKHDELQAAFWWLVLVLVLPYVYTLARATWLGGFRGDRPWPSWTAVLWGVLSSLCESVGICMFALSVLATAQPNITVWAMNGVFAVPILLQIVTVVRRTEGEAGSSSSRPVGRRVTLAILVLAMAFEIGGIVAACALEVKQFGFDLAVKEAWTIPVSLVLLSVAWSPHVQKRQLYPRQDALEKLYRKWLERLRPSEDVGSSNTPPPERPHAADIIITHPEFSARWKASVITSILRFVLVITICIVYAKIDSDLNSGNYPDLIDFGDFGTGFRAMTHRHPLFAPFMVNVFCSVGGCIIGFLACTMCMQKAAFAAPLVLATPVSCAVVFSGWFCQLSGLVPTSGCWPEGVFWFSVLAAACLFVAQVLSTGFFIFRTQTIVMQKASQLFWLPGYNGVFLEQGLLLGRKSIQHNWQQAELIRRAQKSHVIICTTMYRESKREMEQLLASIKKINKAKQMNDRNFESHIFFDNGVRGTKLTEFALQLTCVVKATLEVTSAECTKVLTPYGMRLAWQLPSFFHEKRGMFLVIHFKDNQKVKSKKRWSQVMYMSYVVDYFMSEDVTATFDNTFILTTDADVKFKPESVEALLDLMLRDKSVGAVCSRTFPMGSGPVYWYQIFDYAIGHWLQKAANHVLGSVLCCPGCFSVYRVQAIRDVLATYASQVEEASDFLTKDMGEDRWLCTLLVQSGWRLEYCAVADNSTYCPEEFDEFFKQRRRWIPSTLANQVVLLREWKKLFRRNKQIPFLFMIYQAFLLFSTLINPSLSIFIMVGGLYYAWSVSQLTSTLLLIIITIGFTAVCIYCSADTQLMAAKVLTILSSMMMAAVVIGTIVQIVDENTSPPEETTTFSPAPTPPHNISTTASWLLNKPFSTTPASSLFKLPMSVSSMYLAGLVAIFILTALMHLPEAYCLVHGVWYLLCLPAGNLIMMIYSICNMTDRSWGTREEKQSDFSTSASFVDQFVDILKKVFFCCVKKEGEAAAGDSQAAKPAGTSFDNSQDSGGDEVDGAPVTAERTVSRRQMSARQRSADDGRHYQFANVFASPKPLPVREWLPQNLREQYANNFESNGYDDTSYLFALTDKELRDIGIKSRAHREAIREAIKFFPEPEIEPCVPDDISKWLKNIGLSEYLTNFHRANIVTATNMETLKAMKRKEIKPELGIAKPGHQKRLLLAISKLRHATPMEKEQMQTKHEIETLKLHNLQNIRPEEFDFWDQLRLKRLLPESTVFAHDLELKEKLIELRNSTLLVFAIANVIWLILISTLTTKAQLNILGTNALGLSFLVVFGLILVIQFVCMILHRLSTWMHMIARTPTLCGQRMRSSWTFSELDTVGTSTADPDDEDERAQRECDTINRRLYSAYQRQVRMRRTTSIEPATPGAESERQPLLSDRNLNIRSTATVGGTAAMATGDSQGATASRRVRFIQQSAECV